MDRFSDSLVSKAINAQDDILAPYLAKVDKYDDSFITKRLSYFSNAIKTAILEEAFKQPTNYQRNRHILDTTKKLNKLLPKELGHMFFCYDDDINKKAKECAAYCRNIATNPKLLNFLALNYNNPVNVNGSLQSVNGNIISNKSELNRFEATQAVNGKIKPTANELKRLNSSNSRNGNFPLNHQEIAYNTITRNVTKFGLTPPTPNKRKSLNGCIKRLTDNRWWLRKFRKLITQANEKAAIHLNFVNSKRQIYASNITTKNRIAQRLRNEDLLSSHFIINDAGQRYSLQEISNLNVSNPKIRKDELMCRARGFEDLALELGHEALFITITCPSKYHRAFAKSGAENPKWQGYMPDEANAYLNKQWQKTRAELKRQNIEPYGFRVVEPQHDGTPHWHMLFFIEPTKVNTLQSVIRHYALEIDGDEKGAAENRCDFKKIDPSKGSATGYILKYIVKNIDGKGLEKDLFGNDALLVAQRIDAWASCWRIRQFQQIGGASVSIWRELRRIKQSLFSEKIENSIIEQARNAADNSDWQGYIIAMGGIHIKQKDRPIKLYYDININEQTGECLQSYYDGEIIQKVKGLVCAGKTFVTRAFTWRVEKLSNT
ncbi:replication endonuclease [Thalassotalea sp. G2M2-11]|uniref:replication endonuclease n=1 Tax=Thalassotalea sp. G2M2-11 TaxID=2787627 RepID=UPI0019D0658A|nr:replication endonuclease [Thalassotalea sp. G2M2-11]